MVGQLIARGETRALLVCDAWSANFNVKTWEEIRTEFADRIYLEKRIIPGGTTGQCQPLDVFYFRQWKDYIRTITDSIENELKMWQRDNFIKLQSVAHFQFQAPQFKNMIKFAWHHAGYLEDHPGSFETPKQVRLLIHF